MKNVFLRSLLFTVVAGGLFSFFTISSHNVKAATDNSSSSSSLVSASNIANSSSPSVTESQSKTPIASISQESVWWDTTHNQHFDRHEDIPGNESISVNWEDGKATLSTPAELDSWKFVNITYKGNVYQPGDVISFPIQNEPNKFNETLDNLKKDLRYNYEPQNFNFNISYTGLPSDIEAQQPHSEELLSGSTYTFRGPNIPGYKLTSIDAPGSPYSWNPNVGDSIWVSGGTIYTWVRYNYVQDENYNPSPVTVHYLDYQGNQLLSDIQLSGQVNGAFHTSPKIIPGYTLVKTIGNDSGHFTTSEQSVSYIYLKDSPENYTDISDSDFSNLTGILDCNSQLQLIKNYNVYEKSYSDGKFLMNNVGSVFSLNLQDKKYQISQKLISKNGNIYYQITVDGKIFYVLSAAFEAPITIPLKFESDQELKLYSSISLDVSGNIPTHIVNSNKTFSLEKNYNVYNLERTSGNSDISPYIGTTLSLNLMNQSFLITKMIMSLVGNVYYLIIQNGVNYLVNSVAFITSVA